MSADVGFSSLIDYVGYSVGVPVLAPECGLYGIVDWTGIPCGLAISTPPPDEGEPGVSSSAGGGGKRRRFVPKGKKNHKRDEEAIFFGIWR